MLDRCDWDMEAETLEANEEEPLEEEPLEEDSLLLRLAEDSETADRIFETSDMEELEPEREPLVEPEEASHQLEDSRRDRDEDSEERDDSLIIDCSLETRLRSAVLSEALATEAEMADWMAEIRDALDSEREDSERLDSERA